MTRTTLTMATALTALLVCGAASSALAANDATPLGTGVRLVESDSKDEVRLEAHLGGASIESAARYRDRMRRGLLRQEFSVQVEDFAPESKLLVTVDGKMVGVIVTDAFGGGEIQLRTASFIDEAGDGEPIDPDFPRLHAGSMVKVGPLAGKLE